MTNKCRFVISNIHTFQENNIIKGVLQLSYSKCTSPKKEIQRRKFSPFLYWNKIISTHSSTVKKFIFLNNKPSTKKHALDDV